LSLSLIYFSCLVYIHHQASQLLKEKNAQPIDQNWNPSIRHGIFLAMILIFSQIVLGAFMRHSGAGISCGLGPQNSIMCLDVANWKLSWWPASPQGQLHMVHRFYAVVVAFFVFFFSLRSFFYFKDIHFLKRLSLLPIIFTCFQIFIGIYTVRYNLSPLPTTLHLAGAVLILVSLWKLNLLIKERELEVAGPNTHSLMSDIFDLTKPRLAALVMATVLVGILIAPGHLYFFTALLSFVLIGLVVAGAAALNCYLEKDVDSLMQRTKDRPLPSNRMLPSTALIFGVMLLVVAIPLLFVLINTATGVLALLATVLYLFAYTPMKKKSELAVFVGAIPGAIPPLLGWTTVTGTLDGMALSLFCILFVWQLPHFLAISFFHAEDYEAANLKIYPNQKGFELTKIAIIILTIILFLTALMPTYFANTSVIYTRAAIVLSSAFLLYAIKGVFLDKANLNLQKIWAKNYFYGSLFYLPLLLASLIFFK
jgi:protoheme IX farnesyltransferase